MNEEKKTDKQSLFKNPLVQSIAGIVGVFVVLGGFIFWQDNHNTLFIENSVINAPIINLSASTGGMLNTLYVHEGDTVSVNMPLASVGSDTVTAKQDGIVVGVTNTVGAFFAPGQTVVSMIHPDDLRVVGTIDETKGLDQVHPGQKVTFTVDTYGNKTYVGVVDSVSQTADNTGVVFSISDKRPVNKFDIKVRFTVAQYPELKNGMSAKITVYLK